MNTSTMNISLDVKELTKKISKKGYLVLKRTFDFFVALIALILSAPIFLIVAILIKLDDKGKVFLTQERIGKDGQAFKLYKFRSMVLNADAILMELLKDPAIEKEYKKNKKLHNDPRVTKIGKILRKTSLDELPQLINVLKGEMSLIGNRPYLPREKEDMGKYYKEIIKTKPGITGYWQVNGRSQTTFNERCKLESYYSKNATLLLDFKIFFLTFYVVLTGKGAE